MQHRFAHRLAGDRPGVDAHSLDGALLFDDLLVPCFCSLNGGSLPAGAGANSQSDHTAAFEESCAVESASGDEGSTAESFDV
jgi:hypothetical protein